MNTELWVLLLKTGGSLGVILAAVAWLFRRGGRIGVNVSVDFSNSTEHGGEASMPEGEKA
jgi:hypothetical protein